MPEVSEILAAASVSRKPLLVGTLRGQRADSGEWARDPSTAAIVIGTVDMIGSRLLFRGYQSSAYYRSIYAGLLGVDALVVNDEAHLTPAFSKLLRAVQSMSPAATLPGKTFRILLLSATPEFAEGGRFEHDPLIDAANSERFAAVFHAHKKMTLHQVVRGEFERTMEKLATENPASRTLIFIESPERAATIHARFSEQGCRAALLTGTMRGFERDQLAQNPVFQLFLNRDYSDAPVFLIATSAAEVGVNITCERLITEMVEADHLLQRFGRLNRFGSGEGEAHVVYSSPLKTETLSRTLEFLRGLGGDVSCARLWNTVIPDAAKSPSPLKAELHSHLVECWAQTTFRDNCVPPVGSWLNGKKEGDEPHAEIAWREDIRYLATWTVAPEQLEQVLDAYRVLPHEIISEPESRVRAKLKAISDSSDEMSNARVLVLASDGTPSAQRLSDVAARASLAYVRILLPDGIGSVEHGMFSVRKGAEAAAFDVADERAPERRRLIALDDKTRWVRDVDEEPPALSRSELGIFCRGRFRPPVIVRNPDDDAETIAYFSGKSSQRSESRNVELGEHQSAVAEKAYVISVACGLGSLAPLFRRAGELHDNGKSRRIWKQPMRVPADRCLAKCASSGNPKLLGGYRHELGSLVDVPSDCEDLTAHEVAAHHSSGRPFFQAKQLDRENVRLSREAAFEQVRRFGRLQARYGPWGLAYLDAIFKCAYGLVSAEEGESASV